MGSEGYKAADAASLDGMRQRRHAIESGIAVSHDLAQGRVEAKLTHDVGGGHGGYSARVEYEHFLPTTVAGATSLYFAADYYDRARSNYYFGVRDTEGTDDRAPYEQGAVAAFSAGITHLYPISDRFTVVGSIGYRGFERSVRRSPIVERHDQVRAHAALIYRF